MKHDIRVRFAPSPTGHLHVGGVRTAIFNWLFARNKNGIFVIRIEDTDLKRSKKEYVDSILSSLKWLNISSDESIVYQSSFIENHKKSIEYLLETNQAYRCFCESKEDDKRTVQGYKYDGKCRTRKITKEDLKQPYAIRFKLPADLKCIMFDDLIRGTIIIDYDQLDDFIIVRRDGKPTYNFCVVVDDMNMKITHVIRGEDHISNTPKQILLYQALACKKLPDFVHLPLILGPSGNRLSKRDSAASIDEYKKLGFLPDALFNYLVRLGWSHGDQEVFSRDELVNLFTLKDVGKKGAIFDIQKLTWLNGLYIRNESHTELLRAIDIMKPGASKQLTSLWNNKQLKMLLNEYKERSETLCLLYEQSVAFAKAPENYDILLIHKWHNKNTTIMLDQFLYFLNEQSESFESKMLFDRAKQIAKENSEKIVALAQPLRLALTGITAGPGVFALLCILGKVESIRRIQSLLKHLN